MLKDKYDHKYGHNRIAIKHSFLLKGLPNVAEEANMDETKQLFSMLREAWRVSRCDGTKGWQPILSWKESRAHKIADTRGGLYKYLGRC